MRSRLVVILMLGACGGAAHPPHTPDAPRWWCSTNEGVYPEVGLCERTEAACYDVRDKLVREGGQYTACAPAPTAYCYDLSLKTEAATICTPSSESCSGNRDVMLQAVDGASPTPCEAR